MPSRDEFAILKVRSEDELCDETKQKIFKLSVTCKRGGLWLAELGNIAMSSRIILEDNLEEISRKKVEVGDVRENRDVIFETFLKDIFKFSPS